MADDKKQRPIYVYDVPAECEDTEVKSVGLVQLTTGEELMASKRAHGDNFRLAYELTKQSLVEVNGEKVGIGDGSADVAWSKMAPTTRNLVLGEYAKLHSPPEGAEEAFRKSRRVKLG